MSIITATEFKQNLGAYLDRTIEEDVYITKNNKVIAKLTTPAVRSKRSIADFFGTISTSDYNSKDARLERALRKR